MMFEQLMKKAAEKANDHQLVELTVNEVRAFFDGKDLPEEFSDALDWQQCIVYSNEATERWIIIKIVP
jgi:hypothetical protein